MIRQRGRIFIALTLATILPLILLLATLNFPIQQPNSNPTGTMEPEPYPNGSTTLLTSQDYVILLLTVFIFAIALTVIRLWFTTRSRRFAD